jgi:MFS transporter, PAT family, solute carrier family 33 (acetyl-CoA transportor), member 1
MYLIHVFPAAENITSWNYVQVIGFQIVYSLVSNMLFVSQCAFFARICDESIGGTYMTLLNTIANLGGTWPKFFVLYLADFLSTKTNKYPGLKFITDLNLDGFYIVGTLCVLFGFVWFSVNRSKLLKLQGSSVLVWRVPSNEFDIKTK